MGYQNTYKNQDCVDVFLTILYFILVILSPGPEELRPAALISIILRGRDLLDAF